MARIHVETSKVAGVSDATLERTPARLLDFLQGASEPDVGGLLVPAGWTLETVDEGWTLLNELRALAVPLHAPPPEGDLALAIARCEEWRSTHMGRARAMLQITYPRHDEFLFGPLSGSKGVGAMFDVDGFLWRRRKLMTREGSQADRKANLAALEVIRRSGTTDAMVRELEAAVRRPRHAEPDLRHFVRIDPERRRATLLRMYAWLAAWREVARSMLPRRDHQIRLGIAKRRPPRARAARLALAPTRAAVTDAA